MPAENIVSKDFYPAENIKTISIELSYENLVIKSTNGSDILVEIASNNSKKIPEIFLEANNFIIKSRKNQKWNTGNICTVYVYLPNDFFPKTTNIKVASGEIYIDNLETDELKVSSASGDIKIIFSNVTNEIELSAASGKIEFNTGKTRKFSATTSSGDIFVQQLISKEIWCKVAVQNTCNLCLSGICQEAAGEKFNIVTVAVGHVKLYTAHRHNQNFRSTYGGPVPVAVARNLIQGKAGEFFLQSFAVVIMVAQVDDRIRFDPVYTFKHKPKGGMRVG